MYEGDSKKRVLVVLGTSPEAIKMTPLMLEFKKHENISVSVCSTGQHREMPDQVPDRFGIVPDYDSKIMKQSQTLEEINTGGIIIMN